MQETFLNAYKVIDSFQEESSLSTWLYRIVTNHSLKKLKEQAGNNQVAVESPLPEVEAGEPSALMLDWSRVPELNLRGWELGDFFEKCLDELPVELRVAYILKDLERLREDQVSAVLGISQHTTAKRVHRARLVIRKRLEDRFRSQS